MSTTMKNAKRITGKRIRDRVRELQTLSRDPAVNELAAIAKDIRDLSNRIQAFRDDHGPDHKCFCPGCRAIEERHAGFPGVWDTLTAIAAACWWANLMDSERPHGTVEYESMLDSFEKV